MGGAEPHPYAPPTEIPCVTFGRTDPSASTHAYRTRTLSLSCHSEPVLTLAWESVPVSCHQRPKAATYLCRSAAKARFDNRQTPRVGVSKGEGSQPLPFGRFKERGSLRGEGNRNPSPLKWRFWLLLSLLTKVTRRRQNRKSKSLSP